MPCVMPWGPLQWYSYTVVEEKEETRQTSLWLPASQYDWLRRTAFDRRVSQSEIIRELIAAAMAAPPKGSS